MFFIGGISRELVGEPATASFLRGYGDADVDPVALAYYRHAWATQDVVGYAEQVLVEPSRSDDDRAEAARIFEILFRPGEIVDIARSTGDVTPVRRAGLAGRLALRVAVASLSGAAPSGSVASPILWRSDRLDRGLAISAAALSPSAGLGSLAGHASGVSRASCRWRPNLAARRCSRFCGGLSAMSVSLADRTR